METTGNGEKKSRIRSPNFPALALEKSLDLARILFDNHARHAVPLEVVAKDWGLSAKSSYIAQHIAALSAYGLITVEGSKEGRKVTVSDLAFNIFIDKRPDSQDRARLIREAALKPDIFSKLRAEYDEEPPKDHLLEYTLVKEYDFNPKTVHEFINIFRSTIDYAKVYEYGKIEADITREEDLKMLSASQKTAATGGVIVGGSASTAHSTMDMLREMAGQPITSIMEIPIPIPPDKMITIRVPYPLSEPGWTQMLNILNAYKPSVVPSATWAANTAVTAFESVGTTLTTLYNTEQSMVKAGTLTAAKDAQFQALYKAAYNGYQALGTAMTDGHDGNRHYSDERSGAGDAAHGPVAGPYNGRNDVLTEE